MSTDHRSDPRHIAAVQQMTEPGESLGHAEPPQEPESPTHWIDRAIGRRYRGCTLDGFEASTEDQQKAVQQCRDYVLNFGEHVRDGIGLMLIGPKGTGKDHLMVATVKAICLGYPQRTTRRRRAVYRDGLRMFAEFRGTMKRDAQHSEDTLVAAYVEPHLLALSDPLPPAGTLSEYEQRMLLRIVDGRYRDCRPTTATLNVANRGELDERLGPQTADRLLDGAVVVRCNWPSYRKAFQS